MSTLGRQGGLACCVHATAHMACQLPPSLPPLAPALLGRPPQVRDPLTKKLAEDPGFMGAMQAEVEQLRQQLAGLGVAAGSSSSETAAS